MALQCTTEGRSGSHGYSREQAEPFAIRLQKRIFDSYPPKEQERLRQDVIARLRDQQRSREFGARLANGTRRGSELEKMAWPVYGVKIEDL